MLTLIFTLALTLNQMPVRVPAHHAAPAAAIASGKSAAPLAFKDILVPTDKELKPSAKLLALAGKRVRIVGFMIDQEEPTKGTFYLWKRPVFNDESGAGIGDVPPDAILIVVRGAKNAVINHASRPLAVTGILEVGPHTEENGASSMLRILLDRPQDIPASEKQPAEVKHSSSATLPKNKRSIR